MTSLTYAIHPPFPQSEVEATLQRINGHKVRRQIAPGISRVVPKSRAGTDASLHPMPLLAKRNLLSFLVSSFTLVSLGSRDASLSDTN